MPTENRHPALLDVVALLIDYPALRLASGAVGTVVEPLGETTSLVEFSDGTGRALGIVACPHDGPRVAAAAHG